MILHFTCPNPHCETATIVNAHESLGQWEILTPDQCACCLRVITASDRHALAETAQANVIEGQTAARDAHENHLYDEATNR